MSAVSIRGKDAMSIKADKAVMDKAGKSKDRSTAKGNKVRAKGTARREDALEGIRARTAAPPAATPSRTIAIRRPRQPASHKEKAPSDRCFSFVR
ncbi:hypothetical protein D3C73_1429350 [compost metagenome]